ncbi:MAG: M56 family metallopeptidase, partial [Firmicutes bacterium]|nr:M56 family metallopeptidase [Bacillota bacterium]
MTDIITGDRLLLAILNMSFNGTIIIGIVLVLRWIMLKTMKDLPRNYLVWLWAIPFFRLLCPADLSRWLGKLSLIPWNSQPLSVVNHRAVAGAPYQGIHPQIDTGFVPVDQWLNDAMIQSLPAPMEMASIDPFQITQFVLFLIWALGATALLLVTIWNWWKLRQTISDAVLYRRDGNVKIYETDRISTAFVVGWVRYKIYLPTGLSEEEVNCVLHHEFAHIKRNDPLWKLLAYVSVNLHWFNPIVWFAYKTLIRDIEMACDERAIQNTDPKLYTSALLKLSMRGSGLLAPLAFGEGSIKERIINALKVKEPKRAIRIAAIALICVAAVVCASNQEPDGPILLGEGKQQFTVLAYEGNEIFWETAGFDDEEVQLAIQLREHRTEDAKEHEKVLDLVCEMDWGSDIELDMMTIGTEEAPHRAKLTFLVKEGLDSKTAVIDQGKIATNIWLLFSQVKNLEDVIFEARAKNELETTEVSACGYLRKDIEAVNAEALTYIASVAMDESLHPDGITFRGEPTLWDLGGDTETLLLLIRSLNVARGVQEDVLFGSAKDPGVAMLLPSLPALPVTDTDGSMNELATAATQQMITYIENLPYDISQHELREQGFVTNVRGLISDNRDRWEFFLSQYGKGFEPKSGAVAAGP